MNKKYLIIIGSIIILALFAVGWVSIIKKQESEMGPVSFESFKKTELNGKTIMENKKVGLSFEVPEGWQDSNLLNWVSLSIYSPDFKAFNDKNYPIPSSGCWIDVSVSNEKEGSDYDMNYSSLKNQIANIKNLTDSNSDKEKYELVYIDNKQGIKDDLFIGDNKNNQGDYITVKVPINSIVYSFETHLFGQDKIRCSQEFDNFLKTISIRQK
jgi:hypothetical protein